MAESTAMCRSIAGLLKVRHSTTFAPAAGMEFDDRLPRIGRVLPRSSTLYEWPMGMGLRLVIRCSDGNVVTARIETEEDRQSHTLDAGEWSWRG